MRNYRYFLLFVSATVLLIAYMLAVIITRVILRVVKMGDGSVPKAIEIVASGEGLYSSGCNAAWFYPPSPLPSLPPGFAWTGSIECRVATELVKVAAHGRHSPRLWWREC